MKRLSEFVADLNEVSDEMKSRYIRRASQSHQNAHAHEKEAIRSGKPEKAKKFRDVMNKRNAGMTKAFGEAFGRARFTAALKDKGIDVDKMHAKNVSDADAAKKRSAAAQADLDSFRKKTGVTSEAKLDEISMNTLASYKDKAKYSRDKAQNSAAANYMRGTKGSGGKNDPDIKTMQKRDRGSELYYSNIANKLRKQLADKKK